jgi:hypothetical protein
MAKIIKASFSSKCPITGQPIYPGDRICLYTQAQHDACIAKATEDSVMPYDICEKILNEARGKHIGRWCKEDAVNAFVHATRSSRVVRKPTDQLQRTFVKGSGFVGCDTYDRQFDGDYQESEHVEEDEETTDDEAFINDAPEVPAPTADDEEEEWDSEDEEEDDDDEEWETDSDDDE